MIRLASIRLCLRFALAGLMFSVVGVVSGLEPLEIDLRLLDELNERELFDYSTVHVEKMLRLYPKDRDQILVAKAGTLYAARKSQDAEAALKQIPKDSPFFPDAMLLTGEASFKLRKYEQAVAAYGVYFRKGVVEKRLPDGQDEAAVARFRRHVSVYKAALEKLGKTSEAQRVVGLLGMIPGGADERGTKFLQLRTLLDAEAAKLDQKKPLNRAAVEKGLAGFSQLVFIRDGVGALSYIEMARARVLLGGARLNELVKAKKTGDVKKIRDFVEAVKLLKSAGPLLEDIARAQGGGDELLAGALFYQGKAYRGQALVLYFQKKTDKAEKLLNGAAMCFEKVAADFGDSRYQTLALTEHAKCSSTAKSLFGQEIKLDEENVDAQLKMQLEKGHALFQTKQYKQAIPIYLKAAQVGRRSKKLPTVVSPLVVAMGREGYFVEAEALASYLVEMLPKDEMTALCVLQLGASLKEAAKKEKDVARKAELEDRAAGVWEWFVEIAPLNSRAPMVAYAVADHEYSQALDLARSAKGMKDVKRQEELKAKTREAMAAAIPKLLRVVDQYGTSTFAPMALYSLGWCYYETGQRKEAAEAFLRYADDDDMDPKYAEQRLQAKFRAAECMMLGGQPEESVAQFQELVAWISPGNKPKFDPKSKTAKRLGDVARMDVGYAYDQVAELLRPELTALQDTFKTSDKSVNDCERRITGYQEQLAALQQELATIDQQTENLKKQYTSFELDFQASAKQTAISQGEDPEKLAPDLRAKALENLQVEIARMLAVKEKQAKQNVAGELATIEEELVAVAAERGTLAKQVEELLTNIAAVRKQLPKGKDTVEPEGEAMDRLVPMAAILVRDTEAMATRVKLAQKAFAEKVEQQERASQRLADMEVAQRALEENLTTLRDDVDAATERAKKARLTQERDKAEASLKKLQADLAAGYAAQPDLAKQVVEMREQSDKLSTAFAEVSPRALQLAREARRAALVGKLLDARRSAAAGAKPFAERLGEVLDKPVAEREAQRQELAAMGAKTAAACEGLRQARIAVVEEDKSTAASLLAETQQALSDAKAATVEAEKALAPAKERFQGWKRKAIGAFEDYLKTPSGSPENIAQVLGKLGTTFLELGEFAKAEAMLSRLAKEYPNSDAGKGALFNLARAQSETGKHAEASATFERLLADPQSVSLTNLQYIGRVTLESGQEAVALKACKELVSRSEQKSHPDYEQAQVIRPMSLFRAGTASLGTKHYKQALEYLDTLLKENPKTGLFYEVRFATAEARYSLDPPDLAGAKQDLDEIFDSPDPILKNRADYELGKMWTATKDAELVTKGARRLKVVVELADPRVPENLPWIEKAIVAAAKAYARLGLDAERDAMVKSYRERFPKGKSLPDLKNLPGAEFGQ